MQRGSQGSASLQGISPHPPSPTPPNIPLKWMTYICDAKKNKIKNQLRPKAETTTVTVSDRLVEAGNTQGARES